MHSLTGRVYCLNIAYFANSAKYLSLKIEKDEEVYQFGFGRLDLIPENSTKFPKNIRKNLVRNLIFANHVTVGTNEPIETGLQLSFRNSNFILRI